MEPCNDRASGERMPGEMPQAYAETLDLNHNLLLSLIPLGSQPHPTPTLRAHFPLFQHPHAQRTSGHPALHSSPPFILENCSLSPEEIISLHLFLIITVFPSRAALSLHRQLSSQIAPFPQSVESPMGPLIYWPLIKEIGMEI